MEADEGYRGLRVWGEGIVSALQALGFFCGGDRWLTPPALVVSARWALGGWFLGWMWRLVCGFCAGGWLKLVRANLGVVGMLGLDGVGADRGPRSATGEVGFLRGWLEVVGTNWRSNLATMDWGVGFGG